MKEIKIRYLRHEDYCQELWEVLPEEGKPSRYVMRDDEGRGTWRYASSSDTEPGFATQDDVTLILCDHNWKEQARSGNDRKRFPEFFPTLIDTCREAWNNFLAKPDRVIQTPGFREWISDYIPKGVTKTEEHNWQYHYHKTIKREVLSTFDYCGDPLAIIRLTEHHTLCNAMWRTYFIGMVEEEEYERYIHFIGYEVGNYVISTNPLKIANLPYYFRIGETELSIIRKDINEFNAMIGCADKAPFRSRNPKIKHLVTVLKQQAAVKNTGLTPSINKNYYCETCGSRTGKCHPVTGYCFVCDTDNWRSIENSY